MDHLGGVGYWASQRHLQAMGPARLLVPRDIAEGVEEILATHARLEGGRPYEVQVIPVSPGQVHTFRKDMDLTFFRTDHWVPTLGSRLVWRRRHLLPAFADLPGEEIAARRAAGETVTEEIECHLLSYCADSGPGVLELGPEVLAAEIVVVECSFYRPRDRERAARFGHMHLDDLLARINRLDCRHLVLIHASRRHRLREVERILDDRLRPHLGCELHHLMIDWE
jgi:ribonuclease Z